MAQSLKEQISAAFSVKEADLRTYSPLTLAFLGDAVFSLIIRTAVVAEGNRPADRLHRRTSEYVCAARQAQIADAIQDLLTEEEQKAFRRGGNANPAHHARNASLADYMKATALETLCGYLYMQGNLNRVIELIHEGILRTEPAKSGLPRQAFSQEQHGNSNTDQN